MALYTVFAWTAIVIAGGAYYWVYIRGEPFPTHLLGTSPHSTDSTAEEISISSSQKRKRKSLPSRKRVAPPQSNEFLARVGGISADESEGEPLQAKSSKQVQDGRTGLAENKSLKGILIHSCRCIC
jgi:hypothetical protein